MATNQLKSILQNSSDRHATLQQLRDAGDPQHLFFQTLVEFTTSRVSITNNDQDDKVLNLDGNDTELLFHCAHGMRHVILLKWDALDEKFKCEARDFMMELGGCFEENRQRKLLPKPVAAACLMAAAVFWKRCWLSYQKRKNGNNPSSTLYATTQALVILDIEHLFQLIECILVNSNQSFNHINGAYMTISESCCMFLSTLVGEFNGSSTTGINLGLSLEYHKERHVAFEESGSLKECLRLTMTGLNDIVVKLQSLESASISTDLSRRALAVVQLTTEVLSWEFGGSKAFNSAYLSRKQNASLNLIKPPVDWREYLIRPDFLAAIFNIYSFIRKCFASNSQLHDLLHYLRQLLLMLTSISGDIFVDSSQKVAYSGFLLEGCLSILSNSQNTFIEGEIVDLCCMICRISSNFRLKVISMLPSFPAFLEAMTMISSELLRQNLCECEKCKGDIDMMEDFEWQEEAFNYILESIVSMIDDLDSISNEKSTGLTTNFMSMFASSLTGPIYVAYVQFRIKKSRLEEMYLLTADFDELRENIFASDLDEQMVWAATAGRVSLREALNFLNNQVKSCLPRLLSLFSDSFACSDLSEDTVALLEEVRMIVVCSIHLLTDDNTGETPLIPESILHTCSKDEALCEEMMTLISYFIQIAEQQAAGIALKPEDPRLSPLLGQTLLSFFTKWIPAYILPTKHQYNDEFRNRGIILTCSGKDRSDHIINFCITLCLHYFCFWPQENTVERGATHLLMTLSRRNELRRGIISSPTFEQLVSLQVLATAVTHVASTTPSVNSFPVSQAHLRGYCRLPYASRGHILSALLFASCEKDIRSTSFFQQCIEKLEATFSSLIESLVKGNVDKNSTVCHESVSLCIEQYRGVTATSEVENNERISSFLSRALPYLAGLMEHYADDLGICESLLCLFRDYSEQYIFSLNNSECLVLFKASAELLRAYSISHCQARKIKSSNEEEQDYSDVLCSIQLLIHLSSKDFLDISNTVGSDQVTEIVVFGLEQTLPLMTQGLLHYPTLCTQFFYLISSVIDSYVEKICILPDALFQSLLDAILFGMSHADTFVAKNSLRALSEIAKEQIKCRQQQMPHLHQDIMDKSIEKLFQEVIFQPIIWDRLDSAGAALLALIAIDTNAFSGVVSKICSLLEVEKRNRLQQEFMTLIKPDVVAKVLQHGREGRMNRQLFKKDFENFVKKSHSFMMLK